MSSLKPNIRHYTVATGTHYANKIAVKITNFPQQKSNLFVMRKIG